ncbi:PaaI family thioesterase [Ferviditalea candida]|uniref:PaaI family thioesterase n=1 Tax=Ferviditalea candida TaxID=3108399 RepID=A0ABU5ZGK6_9BACL|nr:PaaI family thioesterase [Paenibacillaceae bacterium T2]
MKEVLDLEKYKKSMEEAAKDTFWDHLGLELVKADGQKVVIALDVKKHHLNPIGILHGGVSATMLDTVMGITVSMARHGEKVVTTTLNVHYLSPFKEGKVYAEGEIVHQSRKTLTAESRLTDENGNLCVFATGSFRII